MVPAEVCLKKTTALFMLELAQLNFHYYNQVLVLRLFVGGAGGGSRNPLRCIRTYIICIDNTFTFSGGDIPLPSYHAF